MGLIADKPHMPPHWRSSRRGEPRKNDRWGEILPQSDGVWGRNPPPTQWGLRGRPVSPTHFTQWVINQGKLFLAVLICVPNFPLDAGSLSNETTEKRLFSHELCYPLLHSLRENVLTVIRRLVSTQHALFSAADSPCRLAGKPREVRAQRESVGSGLSGHRRDYYTSLFVDNRT